jgi:nucleotide-binding universal stress UspA family protein
VSASEYLQTVKERLSSRGYAVEPLIVEGDPAAVILSHAETEEIDLVVTGATGLQGAMKRWLLGSASHKVIVHSVKSVLIVHGQAPKGL